MKMDARGTNGRVLMLPKNDILKCSDGREKMDEWTCANAAEKGHFEVLQWARENGCHWDSQTCSYAASGGYLDVLQWARENGWPWDGWTCLYAENGCFNIFLFIR
jgi:hypothetical protein